MKARITSAIIAAGLMLGGCAVNKTLFATGGSKADGTIELAYQVGPFEEPVIDWVAAGETAKSRCQSWGYSGAEPFGGQQEVCLDADCMNRTVKVPYQCTGKK